MEFSRRCGASAMGFAAGSSRGPPRDAETSSSPRLRPRASKHAGNRKATETRNNESVIPAISQKKQRRHLRARARSHDLTKRSPSRLVDPGALLVPAPRFFLPLGFSFPDCANYNKRRSKKEKRWLWGAQKPRTGNIPADTSLVQPRAQQQEQPCGGGGGALAPRSTGRSGGNRRTRAAIARPSQRTGEVTGAVGAAGTVPGHHQTRCHPDGQAKLRQPPARSTRDATGG